jgi:hypothetical protein
MYGARFRLKFTLEDAIGSHACSLEANRRVFKVLLIGRQLSYLLPLYIAFKHERQQRCASPALQTLTIPEQAQVLVLLCLLVLVLVLSGVVVLPPLI